ncbi:MAG: hypothetical protein ABSD31_16345 [Candidatus Binataceae bacterium]|jgi:hypothetical protein
MISRLMIPTLIGALMVAFVAGCAPAGDNQPQVQTSPAPQAQSTKWQNDDELMATGGDMVLNQSGLPVRA